MTYTVAFHRRIRCVRNCKRRQMKAQLLIVAAATGLLLSIAHPFRARAETLEKTNDFAEMSFEALQGNKKGTPCIISITSQAINLCGLQTVPRNARVDYRYQDRTPINNCNSFGFWCIGQDHSFVIGWKPEGADARTSFTVVFVSREEAERFNKALATWSDTTPADVRGPGWR